MSFDLRTEIRDKSGKTVQTQHYVRRVSSEHGEMYERPPGSKNWVYPNNEPVPAEKLPAHLRPAKVAEPKQASNTIAAPKV